ncbi:hypothetical protein SUGI_1205100 [Cryptomeria japonica]|uniref:UDP-glycosyltransferase 86A1 n=1 Tax=Cryptomeria japonica TaxID=3369 RepID=UPI002414A508|nr:UDP-glycosyltransferase 86A1 [Cryptomeria japonica]GLJ56136.1 hypothetical protein SUGI_1205100 [Cryptomeria japonica]
MSSVHVVVFMYPFQGHIIPIYNLAKHLAAKGVLVTVVCTHDSYARIIKANNGRDPFTHNAHHIRLALVSDGLPQDFDRSLNHHDFNNVLLYKMESHVEELMEDLQRKGPPISCIITDTVFVWADRIAKKFGIPHVSFWTEPIMVFSIYYHWDLLVKNGHHPFTSNEDELINYIPGAPALKLTDLPSYLQERDVSTLKHKIIYQAFQSARGADWIISNTVEELERRTIQELRQQLGMPFCSVGPMFQHHHHDNHNHSKGEVGTSMWAESDCRSWLDSKPKNSVVYVSFGSYAHVSKAQIHEMAIGLLHSKRPFIWVLRPDIVASDVQDILPEGFMEDSKEQGLVVEWVSQLDVLSHSSVGGFLTHCGWNSIMESLWLGVPMLAFPLLTDQYTNCRLIVHEWEVAMSLGQVSRSSNNIRSTLVTRQEIAVTIEEFMEIDGRKGKNLRSNVGSVREVMKKAAMNGGSSKNNLEGFIDYLKGREQSRSPSQLESHI